MISVLTLTYGRKKSLFYRHTKSNFDTFIYTKNYEPK